MKIGILTQPLTSNYGGILQNYALQKTLKSLGHDPYTLDVWVPTWKLWLKLYINYIINIVKGNKNIKRPLSPIEKIKERQPLRDFVRNNISLIPNLSHFSKSIVKNNGLECLIVGSDQVWRPLYNSNITAMYLDFAVGLNIKRLAYAVSFGSEIWEYNDVQTSVCKQLVSSFDAISVREVSGIQLCSNNLNVTAEWVLDPTLLLTEEDYLKICASEKKRDLGVFAYILDTDDSKIKKIQSFAESKGLPCTIVSSGVNLLEDDSVEKWLANIRDSGYVITDSFHGTVFSIIFQRDFYVFGNEKRGNSRFDSLLSKFELQDRIINDFTYDNKSIDWDKVNSLKIQYRAHSINWLLNNLQ